MGAPLQQPGGATTLKSGDIFDDQVDQVVPMASANLQVYLMRVSWRVIVRRCLLESTRV